MARDVEVICVKSEPEYFCHGDWTGSIRLKRFNKLRCARRAAWPNGSHKWAPGDRLRAIRDREIARRMGGAKRYPSLGLRSSLLAIHPQHRPPMSRQQPRSPFRHEEEAASGHEVATISGHAATFTGQLDGYRFAPPILRARQRSAVSNTNGTDSDRHPEVPALLRGPRRMVTSSCMLASFEARFARTSSDERNCAHAGMTQ